MKKILPILAALLVPIFLVVIPLFMTKHNIELYFISIFVGLAVLLIMYGVYVFVEYLMWKKEYNDFLNDKNK